MTTKSEVFCDYCGSRVLPLPEGNKLILWSAWHKGECDKLEVDICSQCALKKLQLVLSVYKLEDKFMRDVFGLLPSRDTDSKAKRIFSAEAAKLEHVWSFVSGKVAPPNNLGETDAAVPRTITEAEEQHQEEIEVLREQVARLNDDNLMLYMLLLKVKTSTETIRSEINRLADKMAEQIAAVEAKIVQSGIYKQKDNSFEDQKTLAIANVERLRQSYLDEFEKEQSVNRHEGNE